MDEDELQELRDNLYESIQERLDAYDWDEAFRKMKGETDDTR